MILYPAIDLKDGQCVRLLRGEMAAATVFGDDPAAQARPFVTQGCDLAAPGGPERRLRGRAGERRSGRGDPGRASTCPASWAAASATWPRSRRWLDKGLARVILGTVAVENPDLVRAGGARLSRQVAVGIDAREGRVATSGWAEETDVQATDLARSFEDAGVAAIIYTDIDRDGAMQGPNVEATGALGPRGHDPGHRLRAACRSLADLIALRDTGRHRWRDLGPRAL